MRCIGGGTVVRLFGSVLLSALILTGCGLPPAVSIASFVADGLSFVTTSKSTTDHAISAVTRQDCALLRVVQNEAVCDPDGEVLVELVGSDPSDEVWTDHGDFHLQDHGENTFGGSARDIATVNLLF